MNECGRGHRNGRTCISAGALAFLTGLLLLCFAVMLVAGGWLDHVPRPSVVAPEQAAIVDHLVSLHADVRTNSDGEIVEVSFFYYHEAENPEVTDGDIACLSNVLSLESLSIDKTNVSDDGLRAIASLPKLQVLWLPLTTDAGFAHIRELRELRILNAGGTRLTDNGLPNLRKLSQLESLDLRSTRVTSSGLKHLSPLSSLQWLRLSNTAVDDDGLESLNQLPALVQLEATFTDISDLGVNHIRPLLQRLEELRLDSTRVTDESLKHIAGSPRLKKLSLANTRVTDVGMADLSDLPQLEELVLNGTKVTDRGVSLVSKCKTLRRLFVYNVVSKTCAKRLEQERPELQIVH